MISKEERKSFSMSNIKTMYHNELLLKKNFSSHKINLSPKTANRDSSRRLYSQNWMIRDQRS